MFDDYRSGFAMLSTSEGRRKKGDLGAVGNSFRWTWAGKVEREMEENAPVVRGDSNGSAHTSVFPSCSLDPLALTSSLIFCSPSAISN